jgi:hypothetical protein
MYPRPTADPSTLRAAGTVLAHPVLQSREMDVTVVVNHHKLLIYNDLRFFSNVAVDAKTQHRGRL